MNTTTRRHDVNPHAPEDEDDHEEHPPRLDISARSLVGFALFVVLSLVALYFLLPQIAGLEETWHRLEDGSPIWLGLALVFTVGMFGGYVLLFHGVYARAAAGRLTLRESYQVCMAGLAATRLFSAGGAGGIVLTAWAMRGAGLRRRVVADKTISFLVLTYLVYTVSLVVFGYGLRFGVFPRAGPVHDDRDPRHAGADRHRAGALDRVRADGLRAPAADARAAPRADRAARAEAGDAAGDRLERDPRRARAPALPRPGAARGDRLLGLPDRRAVGVLRGVRPIAAAGRARARLLHRHARQPAAAAGRDRWGRRRA